MAHPPYDARTTVRTLTALDIGLRVRVEVQSPQRTIFSGAQNLSLKSLISELAELVGSLRVFGYALRGQLEQAMSALQLNAECGSWRYARRAALDLAGLLSHAGERRLASRGRCLRGASCALQIADLLAREAH